MKTIHCKKSEIFYKILLKMYKNENPSISSIPYIVLTEDFSIVLVALYFHPDEEKEENLVTKLEGMGQGNQVVIFE